MTSTSQTSKLGDVQKCPACNAMVSRMSAKCPECGHEFNNVSANSTSQGLLRELQRIEHEKGTIEEKTSRKIQVIQNYPVPNTKEDLIEMITTCHSNSDSGAENAQMREAWKAKTNQLIQKSQIILKGDKDAENIISGIMAGKAQKKKRNMIVIGCVLAAIIIAVCTIWYSSASSASEARDIDTQMTTMKADIKREIQKGEYDEAFAHIDSLNSFMLIHNIPTDRIDDMIGDAYQNLVIALVREDDIEGAALVGLDYREKLDNDYKWKHSGVFKVLVQECEVRNIDDSPLR